MPTTLSPAHRSLAELVCAILMLGLVPLFAKLVPLDATGIIFFRAVFGGLGLLAFLLWRGGHFSLDAPRDYARMFAVGTLFAVHFVTLFHAIQISTVAVAMASVFTFPVMTVLVEPLFSGALPRGVDLALALVAFSGVALIAAPEGSGGAVVAGVPWGLFSAAMFTLRNILHRRWLRQYPISLAMAYQLLVVMLCLLPFAPSPSEIDPNSWLALALLGLVFTAVAHSLFAGSMRHLPAKTAGLMASLQPVISIVAAAVILSEIPDTRTLVGAAMVVSVALFEGISAPRRA